METNFILDDSCHHMTQIMGNSRIESKLILVGKDLSSADKQQQTRGVKTNLFQIGMRDP